MDQRLIQKFLAEAKKKEASYKKRIEEIEKTVFISNIGNGLIEMEANGNYEIISCRLDKKVLEDEETLQDLIISAVNEVIGKIKEEIKKAESSLTPSLPF